MTKLIPPNPITESHWMFHQVRAALAAHTSTAVDVHNSLTNAKGAVEGAWTGDAAGAWSITANGVVTQATQLQEVALGGSYDAALGQLEALAVSYNGVVGELDAAESKIRRRGWRIRKTGEWTVEVTDPSIVLLNASMTPTQSQAPVDTYLSTPAHEQSAINAILTKAHFLLEAADTQYGILASAFRAMVPATWAGQLSAFNAVGIVNPGSMTPVELAAAMARLSKDADPNSALTHEQRTALEDFFGTWSTDPVVMSCYFTYLGGEGTLRLTQATGWTDYGLACSIREGLANGSTQWTQAMADAFLASAVAMQDKDVEAASSAVAFLFNGPTMSGTLSYAAADWADAREGGEDPWTLTYSDYEREDTTYWDEGITPSPCWVNPFEGWTTQRLADGYTITKIDVSGRILRSLGEHPERAVAWLSDGESPIDEDVVRNVRINYWFGERDWTTAGDRGEAPAALLNGALLAPGGPADVTSYDAATWQKVAEISSFAVRALAGNDSITPSTISPEASLGFAGAAVLMLPYLADRDGLGSGAINRELDKGFQERVLADDQTRSVLAVDLAHFDKILTLGMSTPGGLGAVSAYRDQLVTSLKADKDPMTYAAYIGTLDGLVGGAERQAIQQEAAVLDAEIQAKIDGLATLAAAIPIPSIGSSAPHVFQEALAWAQNVSVTELVTHGATELGARSPEGGSGWSTQHEAVAIANFDKAKAAGRDVLEENLRRQIEDWRSEGLSISPTEEAEIVRNGIKRWEDTFENFRETGS